MPDKGFDDVLRDLEDTIFGLEDDSKEAPPEPLEKKLTKEEAKRKRTLPTLVDEKTATDIFKDYMKKERNQRKFEQMGMELVFKPYWFFTYTAQLVMLDENKNIVDAEEIGGRMAIDAVNGQTADYLQDLLDHEPIEVSDMADEIAEVGGEPKIIEPRISEARLEAFVKQKISGVIRVEKENVSVAGFELLWSPVYKFWITLKKRTHNVQIDGCGGYPVNYDDIPLKTKNWFDILRDDIELLSHPKKWREFLRKKREAARKKGGKRSLKPSMRASEAIISLILLIVFLYGLSEGDWLYVFMAIAVTVLLIWFMNARRQKPLLPLPPPPGYGYEEPPPPPPQ